MADAELDDMVSRIAELLQRAPIEPPRMAGHIDEAYIASLAPGGDGVAPTPIPGRGRVGAVSETACQELPTR